MKEELHDTKNPHPEVVFLSAPYVFPPRPSLALSIFKACLTKEGISSVVLYPMFRIVQYMGTELCKSLNSIVSMTLYEEVIFSHLTGAKNLLTVEEYVAAAAKQDCFLNPTSFMEQIRRAMKAAEVCTEETAHEIVDLHPTVLAASSLFTQNNASLAILRRVKELAPDIQTIMGGPNCSGTAGVAILRTYPQVDAIYFGEGDEGIAQACRALASGNDTSLPYGVLRRGNPLPDPLPYAMTRDMNQMPVPDFSDFTQQLEKEMTPDLKKLLTGPFYTSDLKPLFQVEGSRGCWWGEKHPCSFCGLNGAKNVYRSKTPQRLLNEVKALAERYNTTFFELTDNVLSREDTSELPALIADENINFRFTAEVKTNLNRQELSALRKAGFVSVQAGIESLQDHLLLLMGKGGSAINNVAFMISCVQSDIKLMWNILYGIPGEDAEDYEELLALLPKLVHLPPPQIATRITFQRYSQYLLKPEKYGLILEPNRLYPFLYGDNPEMILSSALYYELTGGETFEVFQEHLPLHNRLRDIVRDWQQSWVRGEAAKLIMLDRDDYTIILDTRPCRLASVTFLRGAEEALCKICSLPVSLDKIMRELARDWTEKRILDALDWMIERNYVIHISGKYLLVTVRGTDL